MMILQSLLQAAPGVPLAPPKSHSSPSVPSTIPSPQQPGRAQLEVQPPVWQPTV